MSYLDQWRERRERILDAVEPDEMVPDVPLAHVEPEPVDSVRQIADRLTPQLEALGTELVQEYVSEVLAGRRAPTISATTATGHTRVVLDARERSWRTLLQGLATDVVVALGVLAGDLAHVDFATQHGWTIIGLSVAKTALTAAASYFARLKVVPANEQ